MQDLIRAKKLKSPHPNGILSAQKSLSQCIFFFVKSYIKLFFVCNKPRYIWKVYSLGKQEHLLWSKPYKYYIISSIDLHSTNIPHEIVDRRTLCNPFYQPKKNEKALSIITFQFSMKREVCGSVGPVYYIIHSSCACSTQGYARNFEWMNGKKHEFFVPWGQHHLDMGPNRACWERIEF